MTKYHRLTQEQRASIITSYNLGCSSIEIAKELGIHRTTVTRELKRNSNANGEYNAKDAQERADRRQAEVRRKKTVMTTDMVAEIDTTQRRVESRTNFLSFQEGRQKSKHAQHL